MKDYSFTRSSLGTIKNVTANKGNRSCAICRQLKPKLLL